jgi:predicted DNA-binding mobile mystery protein A
MFTKIDRLAVRQLDKKLQALQHVSSLEQPTEGWIALIRKTINMSLRQLGERLSITPQGVKKIETTEKDGGISINTLRQVGDALNMRLVYGFVPRDQSLGNMIQQQASVMARKIVMRTSATMKLEDQENSKERLEEAIAELTEELKREIPKSLWD